MISGYFSDEEKEERRKVRDEWEENARKQSSNSGTSENESVADE